MTRSYDIGGVVSVMALSSLYILMTQYGLEYPNFYEKLYALLEPLIFMAKHRAKFFEVTISTLHIDLIYYRHRSVVRKSLKVCIRVKLSNSPGNEKVHMGGIP